MHYQRRQRDGLEMPPKVRFKQGGVKCLVETCIADRVAHGLCQRHAARSRRYGLVVEELEAIDKQKSCEVCGTETEDLHVDHCHNSYEVRGVLCGNCNKALGLVNDDIRILIKLAAYIESHMESPA